MEVCNTAKLREAPISGLRTGHSGWCGGANSRNASDGMHAIDIVECSHGLCIQLSYRDLWTRWIIYPKLFGRWRLCHIKDHR